MIPVSIEDFRKVSYLDTSSLGDRVVSLMPLWDGERWHLWVPGPQGLVDVMPVDTVEANYVARSPVSESDLLIPFVEFMWQRASYPEICPIINAICEDFHNMGTSVSKLRFFFDSRDSLRKGDTGRFAATEIEYLVILARTIFDLLQETVARIWEQRIRFYDADRERRRRGRKLPDTFSKLVLRDKQVLRTPEEIERKFGLPPKVASEYAKHAAFFSELRNSRDDIVHGGSELGFIYDTEKGFCVDPHAKPFSSYAKWNDQHRYNKNLVSVLPWVAGVVLRTIDACNALMLAIASEVEFPPEIAPGFRVFVRGPSTRALAEVLRIQEGGSPWWSKESMEGLPNKALQPTPQSGAADG